MIEWTIIKLGEGMTSDLKKVPMLISETTLLSNKYFYEQKYCVRGGRRWQSKVKSKNEKYLFFIFSYDDKLVASYKKFNNTYYFVGFTYNAIMDNKFVQNRDLVAT